MDTGIPAPIVSSPMLYGIFLAALLLGVLMWRFPDLFFTSGEYIVLEDGNKYKIAYKMMLNNTEYYFLKNSSDSNDVCIRKVIFENGEEYVTGLANEEEFDLVFWKFAKRYREQDPIFNSLISSN